MQGVKEQESGAAGVRRLLGGKKERKHVNKETCSDAEDPVRLVTGARPSPFIACCTSTEWSGKKREQRFAAKLELLNILHLTSAC